MSSKCAYCADVEGNLEFFKRYVRISDAISWEGAEGTSDLKLNDGYDFVFGGDSVDKGPGDIRFVNLMVKLKDRYPDRVHLIVGNRDCNKLRLGTELNPEVMSATLEDKSFPYWLPEKDRVTPAEFLKAEGGLEDSVPNRLKWMLKHTMGSDGAFDRRRIEMAILQKKKVADITDEEVVDSYKDMVDPAKPESNFMLKYLERAKLMHKFGAALFVHGGVSDKNCGKLPHSDDECGDVEAWEEKLNGFCASEVKAFKESPTPTGDFHYKKRPGHLLMDYGVNEHGGSDGHQGKTVIYSSHLGKDGNPAPLDAKTEDWLSKGGIKVVVAGHVPHGDSPMVVSGSSVNIVTADTSYSKFGAKDGLMNIEQVREWTGDFEFVSNRGWAVNEVVISADGSAECHGVLTDSDDEAHCSRFRFTIGAAGSSEGDAYVGKKLPDGAWVKCRLVKPDADGKVYVACLAEGRNLKHSRYTEEELKVLFSPATEEKVATSSPVPVPASPPTSGTPPEQQASEMASAAAHPLAAAPAAAEEAPAAPDDESEMEGIALQTMDRSSAAADNDSAALSPGRLGNIESPPPQRDPPPIPSSAEATSSPSPVIDNGCDAIVDSSRGRIEALSSALEQTFASTRDAIHFFKKTSELHDAHARGLLKLHDESTKSKAARSARGLRNRLLNRSKEEHAPRAAAAWSAIETHTHRVSEMYIALAERITRDVVTPLKTTMEAIELEKKDALGLAAKTLKDLKETNAKLAQTSRELAAKAAEEQAPAPAKKTMFGSLFKRERSSAVIAADRDDFERRLAAAKQGHDQVIPSVVAQLTRCEEQRLSAMRSALEVYARATGDLAGCMQTTTPDALAQIEAMDVGLDVADVLAKIDTAAAGAPAREQSPGAGEFSDVIGVENDGKGSAVTEGVW